MSDKNEPEQEKPHKGGGKALIAGAAIGSAAVAAALLYATRRKGKKTPAPTAVPPSGEKPETD
jgi:hypothetical protein